MSNQNPEAAKILAEHFSRVGTIGGKQRSERKQAAGKKNLEKARAMREFYRRNPAIKAAKDGM